MKIKITKEAIGNVAKAGGMVILYGLAAMASRVSVKDVIDTVRYSGNVGYSDAFGAIMDSDMMSSYKNEAIELLKREQDVEYYKAGIKLVHSDMMSSYKMSAIKKIGGEEP